MWNICSKNKLGKSGFFLSQYTPIAVPCYACSKSSTWGLSVSLGIFNSSHINVKVDVFLANWWIIWTCIRHWANVRTLLSLIKALQRHALNKQQAQQSPLFTFQRRKKDYIITTVHLQGIGYFKCFSQEVWHHYYLNKNNHVALFIPWYIKKLIFHNTKFLHFCSTAHHTLLKVLLINPLLEK